MFGEIIIIVITETVLHDIIRKINHFRSLTHQSFRRQLRQNNAVKDDAKLFTIDKVIRETLKTVANLDKS